MATRYITSANEEAASLFFSTGSTFAETEPGVFKMYKADKRERIILIAFVQPYPFLLHRAHRETNVMLSELGASL